MEGVEKARARVRELTPLIFTFDLPIVSTVEIPLDPNDPFLRAIQDQYNIQVCFKEMQNAIIYALLSFLLLMQV